MSVNEKMTAIADNIREITGGTEPLTLDDMAADIPKVYQTGYAEGNEVGLSDGYSEGHRVGYGEGEAAGKDAERLAWWDAVTQSGAKTVFDNLFYGADFSTISGGFDPPYTLKPTYAVSMLRATKGIKRLTDGQIDFSNCISINTILTDSAIEYIGTIDARGTSSISMPFVRCYCLETLEKFIWKDDGTQTIGYQLFDDCPALENITFEGKVGASLSFQWSPLLTSKSVESIMSALHDEAEGKTMTFNTAAKTTYFSAHSDEYADEDEAWDALCDTKPNWTIALIG